MSQGKNKRHSKNFIIYIYIAITTCKITFTLILNNCSLILIFKYNSCYKKLIKRVTYDFLTNKHNNIQYLHNIIFHIIITIKMKKKTFVSLIKLNNN